MNITVYHRKIRNDYIERFLENAREIELKFFASGLSSYGLLNMELEKAVERAMKICRAASISVQDNFKLIYISNQGHLIRDWKLSFLARQLVIINAEATRSFVARAQIELLRSANQ